MSGNRFIGELPSRGCWVNLFEPGIGELVGRCGYDCALLDMEHSPVSLDRLLPMVRAVQLGGARAIVRQPDRDPAWIGRLMDLGADGVMVPMVESRDVAERLARAARYAPDGTRGMAAGIVRASGFGGDSNYVDQSREGFLLIVQIETRTGVEQVSEIAAVEGVDCLFTGPFDLSGSLGHRAQPDHPDTRAAVDAVMTAARDAGRPIATLPSPARDGVSLVEDGYDLVFSGSDVGMLRKAMCQDIARQTQAAASRND